MTDPWHGRKTFQVHEELYQLDRDPKSVVTDFHLLIDHLSVDDPQGMVITQVYPGAYEAHAPMAWTGSHYQACRTWTLTRRGACAA